MKLKTMIERTKTIMNRNNRVFLIYIFLIIMAAFNVTLVYLWTKHAKGFKHPHFSNDITCFDITEGDGLPYIDGKLLNITNNIFFVETSCRGYLDSIQACAVESAAREQFDSLVTVVFAGPVKNKTLNTGVLAKLKKMNVQIVRINMYEALKGTPMGTIMQENLLSRSLTKVAHASDILRLYLLWKYSGVYMDLDLITLKSFYPLNKDFAGMENPIDRKAVATGVIGLSKSHIGRKIASLLVEEVGDSFDYRVDSWSGSGPALLTQILWELCNTTVPFMNRNNCEGFEVYDSKVFYPLESKDYLKYIRSQEIDLNGSYALHMWNKLISTYQRVAPKGSLFAKIANKYCPTVFGLSSDNLGI